MTKYHSVSLVNQAVRSIKLTFNIIFSFPSFLTFLFCVKNDGKEKIMLR